MEKREIKLSPPDISEAEINAIVEVLRSGWITTGPVTKRFEREIAAFCGTQRAVCLNSATAALELTLRILGVGPGDEVITSAYTYTASASIIDHIGARIVLVDTARDSYEMDYDQLESAITERTKAVIPVDIAGVMCDYDRVRSIVEGKSSLFRPSNQIQEALGRIAIVADAAHSIGAVRHGVKSGGAADFTCFSFHAIKNVTTAEGGAVTWRPISGVSDDDLYRQYMLYSLHGQNKDALAKSKLGGWEIDIQCLGFKFNMTDIAAAIGSEQLKRYPALLERRKEITELYNEGLRGLPCQPIQHLGQDFSSSMHLYLVRVDGIDEAARDAIFHRMAQAGIATVVHYKPLPMMTAYKNKGFSISDYPNAFAQYQNEISLPLHTLLSNDDVSYVISHFKKCLQAQG